MLARNQSLVSKALKIYIQEIHFFQRRKAKSLGLQQVRCGAVTFIQRFGSALNLNIHFHSLIPDGVFFLVGDKYQFYRFPGPSFEELSAIVAKIKRKVLRFIEKSGFTEEDSQLGFDAESVGELQSLSISQKAGFGARAGSGLKRFGIKNLERDPEEDPSSANLDGFSLNASVGVPAKDRKRLEQLIRYMARGPLATERLSESFPTQLVYRLNTAWRDGTTHISFSYLDFIARLVALIPPPRMNMVRYHGCFAPNFKDRRLIVKKPVKKVEHSSLAADCATLSLGLERAKRERLRWAEMLKRTFKVDVTVCPKCSGRMEQIAVIKEKATARKILESLGELSSFQSMTVEGDRGPPSDPEFFTDNLDQRDPTW